MPGRLARLVLSAALLCLSAAPAAKAAYSLHHTYAGDSFFEGWDWYGSNDDLTGGTVYYVPQNESADLAYVNEAGNVVIKVDNTTTLGPSAYRDSVRITSQDVYDIGSLVIFDALHTPYGPATWPAMWLHARAWPSGGEIDVFEGVNNAETNQVALHTVAGCYSSNTSSVENGILGSTNCDYTVAANEGCTYRDTRNESYGEAFAANGGGVWAAELASTGISVWFFPRNQVPSDLRSSSATPDPTTWGTPMAHYQEDSCAINQYFAPQQITVNIALCGSWAGQPGVFSQTGIEGDCATYARNPAHFDNAYFELLSISVYTDPSLNTRSGKQIAAGAVGSIGAGSSGSSATSGASTGLKTAAAMALAGAVGAAAVALF
ncbi:hypothetical protein JCM10213_007063 [Rhodosporidiobolus nylandii]